MHDTTDKSLRERPQGISDTTEPAPTPEFLRLLRCLTSPACLEEQGRLHTNPSSDRVGRFELLNDVTGREARVFRKSPCPPHGRRSSINARSHTPMLISADFIEESKLRSGAHHPPASHDEFLARRQRAPRVMPLETKLTSSFEVLNTPNVNPEPAEKEWNASSPRCSTGRGRVATHPPIDRVGRLESLNDVTGRKLRVFRKSPCPPRSSRSAPPSE